MVIAAVLLVIVVGSVAFHLLTPWWTTPLASHWQRMDDTLTITVVITGIFFIAINLFVAYAIWRYRHREGHRATYEPENHRLERWLIGITTVGIVGLLAPGLVVYADYVRAPPDALQLEVVGYQWQWRFRMPGPSGEFGRTDVRFVSPTNPLGLDPSDPAGQDDVIIDAGEVLLPVDRPVKVTMRSVDVLHDFYVPQFRARMNLVPGQVSTFWFTPTRTGRYEAMCAQLCGLGHSAMRAHVVVAEASQFQAWMAQQPSFARTQTPPSAAEGDPVALGRALAQSKGCVACHSSDGSPSVGPTWKGLYGKLETLEDGRRVRVDEQFLRDFIRDPKAMSIQGFPPVMPRIELSEAELDALVAHIKSLATP
ncbi:MULTISPECIES: cytochrome c oxidase subunit II [Caldimonas]|uniref:cytochrome c oxidase subunit II n=1 Tax=Caldimonas TaxID=196013 RepID=UPI000379D5C0|nr:cytochrome c oxidase subunit II [Caldimonas manganoxidans]MCX7660952.1 cytochrome c oxidase subunit II [Caldimonas manganoxidans]